MAVEVTITDNVDEVLELFETALSKALLDIGLTVQADAAENSPVRTGALRDSWTVEVNEGESWVKIGVPLGKLKGDYAKYQELGTSRGVPARHMLRNAVETNKGQFRGITLTEMKNA
jgi:HK97 gp10 family phage protein